MFLLFPLKSVQVHDTILPHKHCIFPMIKKKNYNFSQFSSGISTEKTIKDLLKINGIEAFKFEKYNYDFLINSTLKTAVFLKCVSKKKVNLFLKKYKRTGNAFDIAKRMTTTAVGASMINFFFKEEQFKNYTLVVPCGNYSHECCCFFTKNGNGLAAVYYNPSYSEVTQGVRKNANTTELLRSLKSLNKIQSYYAFCGNVAGVCSGMTWSEIYSLIVHGISPFVNKYIKLESYKNCVTPFSYKKYWGSSSEAVKVDAKVDVKENDKSGENERCGMLKDYDDMLKHTKCSTKLLKVNGAIIDIILNYFAEKQKKD